MLLFVNDRQYHVLGLGFFFYLQGSIEALFVKISENGNWYCISMGNILNAEVIHRMMKCSRKLTLVEKLLFFFSDELTFFFLLKRAKVLGHQAIWGL